VKTTIIFLMLFLAACAKSGGSETASLAAHPNQRLVSSTTFGGHQFVEGYEVSKSFNSCVESPSGWDCSHPMTDCYLDPSISMMGDFKTASNNLAVDYTGTFEPSTYTNGQYVLTNSGYTFAMSWFGEYVDDGVVVTVFSADGAHQCSELYFVGGDL
jgi:hypothetical protein